jgi:hypothetical protein
MRAFLALDLLITLCASANAATVHHSRTHQPVFITASVASSFTAVPGSVHYDTPSYNDPSRFGGGALPVQ